MFPDKIVLQSGLRGGVMTKGQIERLAVGYPYPTDYVEILLVKHRFNVEKVKEILCKPYQEVIESVQAAMH